MERAINLQDTKTERHFTCGISHRLDLAFHLLSAHHVFTFPKKGSAEYFGQRDGEARDRQERASHILLSPLSSNTAIFLRQKTSFNTHSAFSVLEGCAVRWSAGDVSKQNREKMPFSRHWWLALFWLRVHAHTLCFSDCGTTNSQNEDHLLQTPASRYNKKKSGDCHEEKNLRKKTGLQIYR